MGSGRLRRPCQSIGSRASESLPATTSASSALSSAAPAVDPNDDDIQVGDVTWDTSQDPEHWAQQSSRYIREQLTRRFPEQRFRFAFFEHKQDYIDFIMDLIKKGKW